MTKIRCKKCNRWLFSTDADGNHECKCPKCGYINFFPEKTSVGVTLKEVVNEVNRRLY